MATIDNKIVPHLWFDTEARAAAEFYTAIFGGRITHSVTLADTPSGDVEVVSFELFGQGFQAISAGPLFRFNEAISFIVRCDTQAELDEYWDRLTADGGEPVACGWLKDRFGLSWQIVPAILEQMMQSADPAARARVTRAFLGMIRFDIAALQAAFDGEEG